jgi:hypothetical protein
MGIAGDNFLRNTLGNGASRPVTASNPTTGGNGHATLPLNVPPSERGTAATIDIDEATREAERKRVADGPSPWWDISGLQPAPTGGGSGAQGPGGYKFDAENRRRENHRMEQSLVRPPEGRRQSSERRHPEMNRRRNKPMPPALRSTLQCDHNYEMQQYALGVRPSPAKGKRDLCATRRNVSSSHNGDTSGIDTLCK